MAAPIGIMLMFCTPPATTRSAVPLSTAWAAKCTACWDEPHCRSTVTPGTASGRPAASHAVLAMSPACGPRVSTQPNTTSSTASGSTPVRASSARMTCAPRSAGCARARPPPRRPTGVRTASTRYASATPAPLGYASRTRSIYTRAAPLYRQRSADGPDLHARARAAPPGTAHLLCPVDDAGAPGRADHGGRRVRERGGLPGGRPGAWPRRLAGAELAGRARRARGIRDRSAHLHRRGCGRRGAGPVPDAAHRGPDDHAFRHRRAKGALPAPDRGRRDPLLDRLLRARGGHRPGLAAHPRGAGEGGWGGGRVVRDQRPEDVDQPD